LNYESYFSYVKQAVISLILILALGFSTAHTGENHTEEQLDQEEHQREGDFAFLSQEYPAQTREIVMAEIFFVTLLFLFSIYHYRKKGSEED